MNVNSDIPRYYIYQTIIFLTLFESLIAPNFVNVRHHFLIMKLLVLSHAFLAFGLIHAMPAAQKPERDYRPNDFCVTDNSQCSESSVFCAEKRLGTCQTESSTAFNLGTQCNDHISIHGPCDPARNQNSPS